MGGQNYSLGRGFSTGMSSKISNVLAVLAVGGLMFVGSAAAQSATDNTSGAGPGIHDPGHPRVNQVNGRQTHQQKRIGKGFAAVRIALVHAGERNHCGSAAEA